MSNTQLQYQTVHTSSLMYKN